MKCKDCKHFQVDFICKRSKMYLVAPNEKGKKGRKLRSEILSGKTSDMKCFQD